LCSLLTASDCDGTGWQIFLASPQILSAKLGSSRFFERTAFTPSVNAGQYALALAAAGITLLDQSLLEFPAC
jgi:hypothetical protein